MKVILFIGLIFICGVLTGSTINDILLYRKLQKGWIAVGNHLSSVAVKPPTSGGGYKATPQSCLHTDGI